MSNPIVVVGSGISGLNFALKAAQNNDVLLLTKKELVESSTNYAQGGIAAVLDKVDDFGLHVKDTLNAGSNHNNVEAVEFMVSRGPEVIAHLIDYGVNFETYEGRLALTREGGHSVNRIAFKGDYTGKEIEGALVRNVKAHSRIEVVEHALVYDIIVRDKKIAGLCYLRESKKNFAKTNNVVLATGGIGQLYKFTTNPLISTGDGIAMASRVGAEVADMEFVQFHPTAFIPSSGRPFLISETVRGEGAYLVNGDNARFMLKAHPKAELAPRDVVSYEVYKQLKKGPVYLDVRHLGCVQIKARFPKINEYLRENGLDMCIDLIPVRPAAHYICGGVKTDLKGRTNIKGLYAFGETAHTGVHGANRLASNSLLEALVFSSQILEDMDNNELDSKTELNCEINLNMSLDFDEKIAELKKLMWDKVGVVRNEKEVEKALEKLDSLEQDLFNAKEGQGDLEKVLTYRNMLTVAKLIARGAYERKESLGCHIMA